MNVVVVIPTGIGCEIGGHNGDATPVIKLLASTCDNLITHPNAVNASDINEMPENTLYVEGSLLDNFLDGVVNLKKVNQNKILCVTNTPISSTVINSVSAARATIGADIEILGLEYPLKMMGRIGKDGLATGAVTGWEELLNQVKIYKFDALAITTQIDVEKEIKLRYFKEGGVNPWGYVEAIASRSIAQKLGKPTAHSPLEDIFDCEQVKEEMKLIVDPRMSAEMVSVSFLHCILKGLHKAPRMSKQSGLTCYDVDFLITPIDCYRSYPHGVALKNGIKVIAVKENTCCLNEKMPSSVIVVDNYLEAAGMIMASKAGVHPKSVRRPLEQTKIL